MTTDCFHSATAAWFRQRFGCSTAVQAQAWPAIAAGVHTLIAAPTGSGKTLAAFLAAIDALVREGLERGLANRTQVLYISPLKALSNDIQKNLQEPLMGIRDELFLQGLPDVEIRAWVRTGDTSAAERERMRRQPPHIVVTTPESLYILLTSESGRRMLSSVRTVIVDEIHALAGSKRGSHLALSLERLEALCGNSPVRIGLSATQKPLDRVARFLVGGEEPFQIVDTGYNRARDLALEVPSAPLEAVMSNEVWGEVYDRLADLIRNHKTTLIFVNTRRLAERAARFLAERLGEEAVTAHHGSLAKEHRLEAEQRLKSGGLRALVATASLELGIDIGDVDLVCQLGSPRSIAALLQRVGRSGHAVGGCPKGRLFPLSRDDLVECAALLDAVRRSELDRIRLPEQPFDVLAQQIVGEVSCREWSERDLYARFRHAWPYRSLAWDDYIAVLGMLADGFSTRLGRRSAYLHWDRVNGVLRARRGAKLTALTNAGVIPDQFDYDVILNPEGLKIGTLNEDFSFESLPGDIFQLGNTSYRILKIEQGKVYVEDAKGQPPNIPFWFGESPGRTDELSASVSRLRANLERRLGDGEQAALNWLTGEVGLASVVARQLLDYLVAAKAALTALPTHDTVVLERFFDESGDMHLVVHAPFGSRLNRAWGLALRKRFCRKFNFELQAAALEDSIVLSLGATHSFPLDEVPRYLNSSNVRDVLVQALLDAPMFGTRWRWDASIALAVKRNRNGRRVPPPFQRAEAEDLVAVVFPDQLACLENIVGRREVPDHPLVTQTLADCLTDTMDIEGLEQLLASLEKGRVTVVCRDLTGPSPLAQEILSARPYAFLDDAPAEERKTLAVQQRRLLDVRDAEDLGRLDAQAIERVRAEAWPDARTAEELHDGLVVLGFLSETEVNAGPQCSGVTPAMDWGWNHLVRELAAQERVTAMQIPDSGRVWVAAERLMELRAVFPGAAMDPVITAVGVSPPPSRDEALRGLISSRLEGLGPVTADSLAQSIGLPLREIELALLALEGEGYAMRGQFSQVASGTVEWCERRLLARIHRYTLKRLRSEVEPVTPADFMRFLFEWHHLTGDRSEGVEAVMAVLRQLEGCAVPAGIWESEILPGRIDGYLPSQLDHLCASGRVIWTRPIPASKTVAEEGAAERKAGLIRTTPVVLMERGSISHWRCGSSLRDASGLSQAAVKVLDVLRRDGASFFIDAVRESGLLRTQVEQALAELVAAGLVTSDTFAGLRALLTPAQRRPALSARSTGKGRRRRSVAGVDEAGRWSLVRGGASSRGTEGEWSSEAIEHVADVLLGRYGVVFRKLLERETGLPPWRELLYVYHRWEARGEIRGGRFVQGFSGEQFAAAEAVGALRGIRKKSKAGELLAIAGADPLNLTAVVTPGERVSAVAGSRVLYRDGVPVASLVGGTVRFLAEVGERCRWDLAERLVKRVPGLGMKAAGGSVLPI